MWYVPIDLMPKELRLPSTPLWLKLSDQFEVERIWHRGEAEMLKKLDRETFGKFIASSRVAVVLFDARWNGCGKNIRQRLLVLRDARAVDGVTCGEVECDDEVALAREADVANVPAVAYYLHGIHVATFVGARQDVDATVVRLLDGKPVDAPRGLLARVAARLRRKLWP